MIDLFIDWLIDWLIEKYFTLYRQYFSIYDDGQITMYMHVDYMLRIDQIIPLTCQSSW